MQTAVFDVGKTHARLSVIDEHGDFVFQRRTDNAVRNAPPYPHFDVERLFTWLSVAVREALARTSVRRLICTTHGAAGALVNRGELALPVMDYEWPGPDGSAAAYEALRDPFSATLSPNLPTGLNLARQLFWQSTLWPGEYAKTDGFLTYPQYWAWRLCGERAAELSSLGSHTDLWRPLAAAPSALAGQLGIDWRLPPLRDAGSVLGLLDPERLLLDRPAPPIEVLCGVHDSSAAYIAHYPQPQHPGTVVSTGTWIVCMTPLLDAERLDERRDVSGTVSVHGTPLACSRFMGGREFAMLSGSDGLGASPRPPDLADLFAAGSFALPPHAPSGPFQQTGHAGDFSGPVPESAAARAALAAAYCALVTDVCLDLIGARGPLVVDGPFGTNGLYMGILAALRAHDSVSASAWTEGPAVGAARLAHGTAFRPRSMIAPTAPLMADAVLEYRERWRAQLARRDSYSAG